MTVHLRPSGGGFTQKDFTPLDEHYGEQTIQTHVMAAYAEAGLDEMDRALRLSEDYFVLDRDAFLRRWLPGRGAEIRRQTTRTSWKAIVEALDNPVQQKIVSDDREQTNVLVLAGPGSGKTRVLVHRIAYLVRVRREDPRGILVLAYNRHAAAEIRARLRHLIGNDASRVTVSTCHALAMRLVGASFAGASGDAHDFDGIVLEAVRQLSGEGLTKSEAEAQRDALIQGYRWILVDEYQDIGPEEYALIAAVAGRSLDDPDLRLSLFAVGDDDQNIYAFAGASIRFIRQFEADYKARPEFLTENYRSTRHIIDAAKSVIAPAASRMKTEHDITIDQKRSKDPPGGVMTALDPVAAGRGQLLQCQPGDVAQAVAAVDELVRLSRHDPEWTWSRAAIVSRDWRRLAPVRAYAEAQGIPVEMANESLPNIWRLREMQTFVADLRHEPTKLLGISDLLNVLNSLNRSRWTDLIAEGIAALAREIADKAMPVPDLVEWFAEWSRDTRGDQRGLLLLTAHRAKGLEFNDVVILDGGWEQPSRGEDADAPRRLSRGLAEEHPDAWRLPAEPVERAARSTLIALLRDPDHIVAMLSEGCSASAHRQLLGRIDRLSKGIGRSSGAVLREHLLDLQARIEIGQDSITVSISSTALAGSLSICADGGAPDQRLTCSQPLTLRKRGVETKLVLGNIVIDEPDRALIELVANARRWMRRLCDGEVASIRALGREVNLDHRHVTRALPLAFLAPDIVETIIDGRQPAGMTITSLKRTDPLPMRWENQRVLLGMPAGT